MELPPGKCPDCGARIEDPGAGHCKYCGTLLSPARPIVEVQPSRKSQPEVLAEVERDSRFASLRCRASAAGEYARMAVTIVLGIVFTCMAVFIYSRFMRANVQAGGFLGVMAFLPLVIGVIGALVVIGSLSRAAKFSSAPLVKTAALVVDERTNVSGGGQNTSPRTSYFVTLEFRDGTRRELRARGELAGLLKPGDVGAAFLKGDLLLDFQRLAAVVAA